MTTVRNRVGSRTYHPHAYHFVFSALRFIQGRLGRNSAFEETGHISGRELLEGVRLLSIQHFGMLAIPVLAHWGITATDDIGRIVFELIESGQMRKNDQDQITDFYGVFDFNKAFHEDYTIDLDSAFTV
jgi:uncharacterized repeat protein (TIGR04138 family)